MVNRTTAQRTLESVELGVDGARRRAVFAMATELFAIAALNSTVAVAVVGIFIVGVSVELVLRSRRLSPFHRRRHIFTVARRDVVGVGFYRSSHETCKRHTVARRDIVGVGIYRSAHEICKNHTSIQPISSSRTLIHIQKEHARCSHNIIARTAGTKRTCFGVSPAAAYFRRRSRNLLTKETSSESEYSFSSRTL